MIYAAALFTGLFGAVISVICGFGVGIFTMIFLPYFMSSTLASAAVVAITSGFQSAWICFHYRKKVQWKDIIFTTLGYFVFSAIAVTFGKNIPTQILKLGLGILMILLALYFIFLSKRLKINATARNGFVAGSLGGVMSALFGIGGPPASVYFSSSYDEKETYLATIQTYFLLSNIYVTTVRAFNGIITKEVLIVSMISVAGMTVGTCIGKKVFDKINANMMRKGIYILMAVSGITLIYGALK